MNRQERRQAVSAYHVQLLLDRVLERLGIKLNRMVFRTSLNPDNGKPFLKVDIDDGKRLAAALAALSTAPSRHARGAAPLTTDCHRDEGA